MKIFRHRINDTKGISGNRIIKLEEDMLLNEFVRIISGEIWVESVVEKGSAFTIGIPKKSQLLEDIKSFNGWLNLF